MKFEIKQRVAALRKIMQRNGIQAFILPTTDPHNSEYVAAHWEARKWLTGFTGSAGTAVITMKKQGYGRTHVISCKLPSSWKVQVSPYLKTACPELLLLPNGFLKNLKRRYHRNGRMGKRYRF